MCGFFIKCNTGLKCDNNSKTSYIQLLDTSQLLDFATQNDRITGPESIK